MAENYPPDSKVFFAASTATAFATSITTSTQLEPALETRDLTFAPNITIQGNADYNVMMNAMTDAKEQFEQWFNEMMRKQQRTAYAR